MGEPSFVVGALAGAIATLGPSDRARLAVLAGLDATTVDQRVEQGLPVVVQAFDDLDAAAARARLLRRQHGLPVQALPARTGAALALWGPIALPAASLLVILIAGVWYGAWSPAVGAIGAALIVTWVGRSLWGSLGAVRGMRRVMGRDVVG